MEARIFFGSFLAHLPIPIGTTLYSKLSVPSFAHGIKKQNLNLQNQKNPYLASENLLISSILSRIGAWGGSLKPFTLVHCGSQGLTSEIVGFSG